MSHHRQYRRSLQSFHCQNAVLKWDTSVGWGRVWSGQEVDICGAVHGWAVKAHAIICDGVRGQPMLGRWSAECVIITRCVNILLLRHWHWCSVTQTIIYCACCIVLLCLSTALREVTMNTLNSQWRDERAAGITLLSVNSSIQRNGYLVKEYWN